MKLTADQIQKAIEKYPYWDEKVLGIECLYYGDQIAIYYSSDKVVAELIFFQCYYIEFDHFEGFDKRENVSELLYSQIPYFLHDIKIMSCTSIDKTSPSLFEATIDCSPLSLKIRFRDFSIRETERQFFQNGRTVL